jgi:hypothetical protein
MKYLKLYEKFRLILEAAGKRCVLIDGTSSAGKTYMSEGLTKKGWVIIGSDNFSDENAARKRLYSSFCTKFCKEKNLNLSNRGNDDYIMYLIFKKDLSDIDKENVFKSVKKVIEQGK